MANERKTERIVRNHLELFTDIIEMEEQKSDNPKINKLLKTASKKGNQEAYQRVNCFIQELQGNPYLPEETKKEIHKHFCVIQEPFAIEEFFNNLNTIVTNEQRPILQAIFATYRQQLSFQSNLVSINAKLLSEIRSLRDIHEKNQKYIEDLVTFKNKVIEEQERKLAIRNKRLNRKKRQQSQPFLKEYLPWILQYIENLPKLKTLTKTRLRVAVIILIITGLRISEVRGVKLQQIMSLVNNNFMLVDLAKRGRQGHKTFLSSEGKKLLKEHREAIFELLFLTGTISLNQNNINFNAEPFNQLFLFSSEHSKGKTPISRQSFNFLLNLVLLNVPEFKERGILLTSHSFRRGYITFLWKQTKDIEFVRQIIGHQDIKTTSFYISELSDTDKFERLNNLS
uniref:Tyr recombinase domain-containing protein n=1 Tax=Pseudochlorodesmis sp. HV01306c TaxID=2358490 RepID=A0A386AYG8_9CHLO|nr:hypothetical protein [Pseudochlorodesmis sp. HV01306c]